MVRSQTSSQTIPSDLLTVHDLLSMVTSFQDFARVRLEGPLTRLGFGAPQGTDYTFA